MDIEGVFKKVKKTVKKAVKATVQTSTEVIDYGKCKIKISSLKDKIEENFTKIGECVFNKNIYDADVDTDELEKLCNEIVEWKSEIESLSETIKKSKNNSDENQKSNESNSVTEDDIEN